MVKVHDLVFVVSLWDSVTSCTYEDSKKSRFKLTSAENNLEGMRGSAVKKILDFWENSKMFVFQPSFSNFLGKDQRHFWKVENSHKFAKFSIFQLSSRSLNEI